MVAQPAPEGPLASVLPSGHDVFVSYARENSARAEALVEILEIEGYTVAWDQKFESLVPWDKQIERAIDRAKLAVIVLWSSAAVESEMVRAEVHRACRREGVLLPARIEDVEPPFPHTLANALDLQTLDPVSLQRLLDELAERKRRRVPGSSRPPRSSAPPSLPPDRAAFLLRMGGVATAVIACVFLLLGTGLVDLLFGTDTKLRFVSVWARSLFLPPIAEAPLSYVPVGEESVQKLGPFGASFRKAHAEIVRAASRAGAKVVAFDVFFPPPRQGAPEAPGTAELAAAIDEARSAGTAVVIGEDRRGQTDPQLKAALLRPAAGAGQIATVCIGLKGEFALSAPLLVATRSGDSLRDPVPSLSLASYAAFVGADAARPLLGPGPTLQLPQASSLEPRSLVVSELDRLNGSRLESCAFFRSGADTVASMVIDFPVSSRYGPGPRVIEYADLLALARRGGAEAELKSKLGGRLVLVGTRLPNRDRFPVFGWDGGHAWGSELHAYAMETLFSGRALRLVSNAGHLALIALVGSVAAFVRLFYRRDRRRRRAGLAILLALNAAFVVASAVWLDLLIDGVYQTLAIVLMYQLCGRYVSPWSKWIAAKGSA